jgi:MFS family permease
VPEDAPAAKTAADESIFSREYRTATITYAVVMTVTALAGLAIVPTLPVAARALHGLWLYPVVATAFVAANVLGGLIGGSWTDRYGVGRPLAVGMALAVGTLLVSATSISIWQLAAGRFLDGICAGMIAVAVSTAIGRTFSDRLRPRALALMSACWIGPSVVGPPVAGLVASWWSWRDVFYGLAVLTAGPAVVVMLRLRDMPRPAPPSTIPGDQQRPGALTALTAVLGAGLLEYAASGWDLARLGFGVAAVALLAPSVKRMLPRGTLRGTPGLPAIALLYGLGSGAYFTIEAFVPLLLDTQRHVAPAVTGLAFTGAAMTWSVASWLQSRSPASRPRYKMVCAGGLLLTAAAAAGAVGTFPGLPALTAGSALLLAAAGMGLYSTTLTVQALASVLPERQGYASASLVTAQNLGQIVVLGAASVVLNACVAAGSERAGFAAAFGLLAVPALLAAVLAARTATPDP